MIRIFNLSLLLFLSLLFISCNSNPSDPNTENIYAISGIVFYQSSSYVSSPYKLGASVILDKDTVISNSKGEYTFEKVSSGKHIIKVFLPDYKTYLDTIQVSSDKKIDIHLVRETDTTINYCTVSGTVYDVYYAPGPPTSPSYYPVNDVIVTLGEDTVFSDANGIYNFNKVKPGTYILSVLMTGYDPYNKTITVTYYNTKEDIWLFRIKDDYFPEIHVNAQIKYKYTNNDCRLNNILSQGEAMWHITSVDEQDGNLTYSGEEIIIFTTTVNGENPRTDTLTSTLIITEDKFHQVKIVSSYYWSGITFNRFYDSRAGDIIEFNMDQNIEKKLWLKKSVGILEMLYTPRACVSTTYQLIE